MASPVTRAAESTGRRTVELPGPVVVIVGPTAGGKSDLAVEAATAFGGEVVNADAMSLYRGMDIGTAKPTLAERRSVPHHLLDVWDVTYRANVVEYRAAARQVVADVLARGRVPVVVGGSGLYVRAVTDDLEFPGTDPDVRAALEAELEAVGAHALHERLAAVDPAAAAAILPGNGRRIVRALEVVTLTGRPFVAVLPPPRRAYRCVVVGIDRSVPSADERIERRVREMFDRGLVAEVEALVEQGLRDAPTASRALGYRQVLEWLDGGGPLTEATTATVRGTRRLARRQRAWFRAEPDVHWVDGDSGDHVREALSVIAHRVGA